MGKLTTPLSKPPQAQGQGNTQPPIYDNTTELEKILQLLSEEFSEGQTEPIIEFITLATGGTFQQLFTGLKPVKKALIQNISTENVTITTAKQSTAARGIILTGAIVAGEGGGSMPVSNVDLSKFWFVRTTAGVTLAVYYERGI